MLLYGDGAAGMSLMDVDTLVRHHLPVVMVCGNNSAWGLEKGPMQMLYGYDVAADLGPQTRYDEVVKALGGAGETVTDPRADRTCPRPRLRRERPLPRQRDHRCQRGLPPQHLRHLSRGQGFEVRPVLAEELAEVGRLTVGRLHRRRPARGRPTATSQKLADTARRAREAEVWVAASETAGCSVR